MGNPEECLRGYDVLPGSFVAAKNDGTIAESDEECQRQCAQDDLCTAWIRQQSTKTCFKSIQEGDIEFVQRDDRNAGLVSCLRSSEKTGERCLKGYDLVSGFEAARGDDSSAFSDKECQDKCAADSECTAWIRQPSMDKCFQTKQTGKIRFQPTADRNAGLVDCKDEIPSKPVYKEEWCNWYKTGEEPLEELPPDKVSELYRRTLGTGTNFVAKCNDRNDRYVEVSVQIPTPTVFPPAQTGQGTTQNPISRPTPSQDTEQIGDPGLDQVSPGPMAAQPVATSPSDDTAPEPGPLPAPANSSEKEEDELSKILRKIKEDHSIDIKTKHVMVGSFCFLALIIWFFMR